MDEKQKILTEMVSQFCTDNLDEECGELCCRLIEKMSLKDKVPFTRGKLENWASGIVYAISQINFLFDNSSEVYTSPDEICRYFNTNKSTVSNKARDIRKMFDLGHFDSEFSLKSILDSQPVYYQSSSGFIIPEELIINNDDLEVIMDMIDGETEIPESLHWVFISCLMNSNLLCTPFSESITFLVTDCGNKFFPFFTSREEFSKTFPEIESPVPFSFYDFCEIVYENNGEMDFDGVKLNPDSQDFFFSCEMMCEFYEMFE